MEKMLHLKHRTTLTVKLWEENDKKFISFDTDEMIFSVSPDTKKEGEREISFKGASCYFDSSLNEKGNVIKTDIHEEWLIEITFTEKEIVCSINNHTLGTEDIISI